jgi:hypothetical protein
MRFIRLSLSVLCSAVAIGLCGCEGLAPEAGGSADSAYGEATAQASQAGSARTDLQALQQNRQNDSQVINEAQRAVGSIGR